MRTALFWVIGSWAALCTGAALAVTDVRPLTAMAFGFIAVLCTLAAFTDED